MAAVVAGRPPVKRTTLSLAVVVAVLALVVGLATVTRPSESKAAPAPAAVSVPVQQAEASCPSVRQLPNSTTTLTALAPPARTAADGADGADGDGASIVELGDRTRSRAELDAPGTLAAVTVDNVEVPPLVAKAGGALAPGFAAQEVTRVPSGAGRGLAGVVCESPTNDRWFVGSSTVVGRDAYLYLSNAKDTAALVDIELFGPDGPIGTEAGRGLSIAPGRSQAILLRTLNPAAVVPGLAVHVVARTGRVGAALRDQEGTLGTDWLPSTAAPARELTIPGLPGDAKNVQLMLLSPSGVTTDVQISIAGPNNTFKPADKDTAEAKNNKLTVIDLGPVTRGSAGALRITAGRADIVAGVRVVRGTAPDTEVAFYAATPPITGRAVVSDARAAAGGASTVSLTAPKGAAKVTLTSIADKGDPATVEVAVPAGTTVQVPVPVPAGATRFAVIAETADAGQDAAQPVHGVRTITQGIGKVPAFTAQAFVSAPETVSVPKAHSDMSLLVPEK